MVMENGKIKSKLEKRKRKGSIKEERERRVKRFL